MTTVVDVTPATDRELVLARIIDAPREKVFRCWTDATLLPRWFAPLPWTTSSAKLDVRAGGSSVVVMRSPEGVDYPNPGLYLEVVPNEKLVFTDTYTEGWKPNPEPFMTAIVTFEDAGDGKTTYTAIARHRNPESAKQHADMGFYDGWGTVATQLEEYAQGLAAK